MRTPDGRWQVEVLTVRGRQSYRVKDLHTPTPPGSARPASGRTVATIADVRAIIGDAFTELVEVRDRQRMDGGR